MPFKTILVTGCSAGGIGAAVAVALAKRGHHVFATARSVSKIPPELSALPNVTVLPLDVASASSAAEAAQAVAASGRPLDVLLNNAGAGYSMPVLDVDVDQAMRVYDANVLGVVRAVQAFAPMLIESKGRVVNVSSCGATVNAPVVRLYKGRSYHSLRDAAPGAVPVRRRRHHHHGGAIATHFHDNEPEFKLPAGSLYAPIEGIIAGWASGKSKPGVGPAEEFVESIMDDVVGDGRKGGLVWKGPHAGSIKFIANWLPAWCQDAAMSVNQGLKELTQHLISNK
ncbi:oxidoreductase [Hypoxylon rubiginosum]|uniref:Oxidoreductase n=1 Tax=Hypoxylon rubiginosum TaxID=110542 RepID=A0ACB9YVL4_9PEZI|nr:oxidoreductase [Hypoxylon rubiginosum]